MRNILIPNDIKNPVSPEENGGVDPGNISFVQDFLLKAVLRDPRWGKDLESLMAAADLKELFMNAQPGQVISVSEGLWDKMAEIIQRPSNPYNPTVMVACMPFFNAIMRAPASNV